MKRLRLLLLVGLLPSVAQAYTLKGASVTIPVPISIKQYGAYGDGSHDDTLAFRHAFSTQPVGVHIFIPQGTYLITSSITLTSNRLVIEGESVEANLNFNPAVSNSTLFVSNGNLDNVIYKNLTITLANLTRANCIACNHPIGDSEIKWENVNFQKWNRYAITIGAGVPYCEIRDCRFLRIEDTTSGFLSTAVQSDGANAIHIENNFFTECDRSIQFNAGSGVTVRKNTFEAGADSGSTLIDGQCAFTNVKNLDYSDNYHEGNKTATGSGVLQLIGCWVPQVISNYWNGQSGNTPESDIFIQILGNATFTPFISNNFFLEPTTVFVNTNQVVQMDNNFFRISNSSKTAIADIQSFITGSSLVQFNQTVSNVTYRTLPQDFVNQPEFLIGNSTGPVDFTGDGTIYTILWSSINFLNNGFTIDSTSGTVTVPYTGQYQLCAQVTLEHVLNTHDNLDVKINTSNRQYDYILCGLLARTDQSLPLCVLAPMKAGDIARVNVSASGGTKTVDLMGDIRYNYFSGYFVGQ